MAANPAPIPLLPSSCPPSRAATAFATRARAVAALTAFLALATAPLAHAQDAAQAAAAASIAPESTIVRPAARAETVPVPHARDAADTPAIWIHPTDPAKSLVLGTDKHGGLMVYNLDGSERQLVSDGSRPNDVDVLYDFPLGGKTVDLAVASCRPTNTAGGIKVWSIDPSSGALSDVTAGTALPVFGDSIRLYGLCVYHSARNGASYCFVTNKRGNIEQYHLEDNGAGRVGAALVRSFGVGSISEGCTADDERGVLYVAEERFGIWKFEAEPDASNAPTLVTRVGEHGLTADVEGLSLYYATSGTGYLIASSQGSSTFKVYDRRGINPYLLTIDPQAGAFGDVEHTDGIAVTNCPTSRRFPFGFLVTQDGLGETGNQNFKLFAWEDIAAGHLLMDTRWSPRRTAGAASAAVAADEAIDGADRDRACAWGGESQPLEVETARLAAAGSMKLETGFEREMTSYRTESALPLTFDYAVTDRVELVIEPVLYTHVSGPARSLATGLGDLELTLIVLTLPESPRRPGVAVGGEVRLPTARSRTIGSGKADYTGKLIFSKDLGGFGTHLNLGYAIVGKPESPGRYHVFQYGIASVRALGRIDAVAGIMGLSRKIDDADFDASHATGTDLGGEALIGTLGARFHATERLVLSAGLSYDNDHAVHVQSGLGLHFH